MKTSDKEFNKLLKKYSAKKLIDMHIMSEINLTSKQLDKVIKLKNGEVYGKRSIWVFMPKPSWER